MRLTRREQRWMRARIVEVGAELKAAWEAMPHDEQTRRLCLLYDEIFREPA